MKPLAFVRFAFGIAAFLASTSIASAQCRPTVEVDVETPLIDFGDTLRFFATFENPCSQSFDVEVVSWMTGTLGRPMSLLEGGYILNLEPGDAFVDRYEQLITDDNDQGRYTIGFRMIDRVTAETIAFAQSAFSLEIMLIDFAVTPGSRITDNSTVTSTIDIPLVNQSVTSDFNVDIDLTHTHIGDLRITLTSPSGRQVTLHDRSGGGSDNRIGNYPSTLTPDESLSRLVGEDLSGTWTLTISDQAGGDTGTLRSWAIKDYGAR